MKAARMNDYGDASVITIVEIGKPTTQEGQVLVEVHASSLNPFDSKVRDGAMRDGIALELPVTLGGDIAGIITGVGTNVVGFAVGDKVFGQANVVAGNSGAFAEYAATAASQVAHAPANLSMQEAASLPLVGVSAVQALTQHIKLQAGQKLFINGTGGIGQIAIQLAKHLGAHVAVTATGDDIAAAQQLGADEVVDYVSQDFAEVLHDYDAVFDTVGGALFTKTLQVLKRGGIAVSMAGQADEATAHQLGVTAISQFTHVTTEALDQLRGFIEECVITPHIGKIFTLDDIRAAFTARETGTVKGKVVIAIKA